MQSTASDDAGPTAATASPSGSVRLGRPRAVVPPTGDMHHLCNGSNASKFSSSTDLFPSSTRSSISGFRSTVTAAGGGLRLIGSHGGVGGPSSAAERSSSIDIFNGGGGCFDFTGPKDISASSDSAMGGSLLTSSSATNSPLLRPANRHRHFPLPPVYHHHLYQNTFRVLNSQQQQQQQPAASSSGTVFQSSASARASPSLLSRESNPECFAVVHRNVSAFSPPVEKAGKVGHHELARSPSDHFYFKISDGKTEFI